MWELVHMLHNSIATMSQYYYDNINLEQLYVIYPENVEATML
jgi:hypothetical protein